MGSTDVKWCPDGQRLLTTTCAPRLDKAMDIKFGIILGHCYMKGIFLPMKNSGKLTGKQQVLVLLDSSRYLKRKLVAYREVNPRSRNKFTDPQGQEEPKVRSN